jgi:hypothetical protein
MDQQQRRLARAGLADVMHIGLEGAGAHAPAEFGIGHRRGSRRCSGGSSQAHVLGLLQSLIITLRSSV